MTLLNPSLHSREEIIAELRREFDRRATVYPELIASGAITWEEADRRCGCIVAAILLLDPHHFAAVAA